MRGIRIYLTLTLIAFFMLNASSITRAQSLSDARSAFSKGQYKTAVPYYNAIIEEYKDNGQSTYNLEQERSKAITCRDLLSEVERLKKKNRYSDAIAKLRQIANINSADPTIKAKIREFESLREQYLAQKAIEDDWNNCRNLTDYYNFRRVHPNSKYDSQASSKIKELEIQADEERWKLALERNTVESYQTYINSKTSYSSHIAEANQKLFPLLISRASRFFENHAYASAKNVYEKAKQLFSLPDISSKNYRKSCEEVDFEKLSKASYRFKTALQGFISQYPYSEHLSLVRGWLVENEMSSGNFDAARSIVETYPVSFSESLTPDVKWWRKNIKAREKQYKKDHPGKTSTNTTKKKQPSRNYGRKQLLVRLPISLGVGTITDQYRYTMGASSKQYNAMAKLGLGLGIGSYDNRFNFDILATVWGNGDVNTAYLFALAPSINILKFDDYDYHINLQPYYGWHSVAGNTFGLRAGIGWQFSDFSLGASYGANTGFMADITFRINIHLFRL